MIKIKNKKDCSGCHACFNVCPKNSITMIEDKEGFLYPNVDYDTCVNCGLCEKICSTVNNRNNHKEMVNNIESFACINKKEDIRLKSSSGGIFTLFAENIIDNGGIVFGAGFDENFNLVHSYTDKIHDLVKFRGSKYLQSKIGETYKQAKEFLEKGTTVLFTGTPCQISGLLAYLGKNYDNLICLDIICHGVPSPKVFNMFKSELERKYNGTIRKANFRSKDYGWKLFSLWFLFDNQKEYRKDLTQDIFMRGFLQNLFLRPSCYDCRFKTLNRLSDITIADFWGVKNLVPELDDDKGTSLVLINSNKGKNMFKHLQINMISKEVNCVESIKYNQAAIKSAAINSERYNFFDNLNLYADNISDLINKYTKVRLDKKVYRKIRAVMLKFKKYILK